MGVKKRAVMASAGARAYNGGLGAEPPEGSRGRAPDQGVRGAKPPEAEKLFAFRRPLESANLLLFSLYCRLSKLLNFQSNTDSGDRPGSHLGLRSRLDLKFS